MSRSPNGLFSCSRCQPAKGLVAHPCDAIGDIVLSPRGPLHAVPFLPSTGRVSIPQQKSTAAGCAFSSSAWKGGAKGACKLLNYNGAAENLGKRPAHGRKLTAPLINFRPCLFRCRQIVSRLRRRQDFSGYAKKIEKNRNFHRSTADNNDPVTLSRYLSACGGGHSLPGRIRYCVPDGVLTQVRPCVFLANRTFPGPDVRFSRFGLFSTLLPRKENAASPKGHGTSFTLGVIAERSSADVAGAHEAERAERRRHFGVADAGVAARSAGVPSDLDEIGLGEDEQHGGCDLGCGATRAPVISMGGIYARSRRKPRPISSRNVAF